MLHQIPISILNRTPLKRVLQRLSEGVIPVFMLHRIDNESVNGISVEQIDHFLVLLKRYGYEFIGLNELRSIVSKPGAPVRNKVMFTLDDGYIDQITKGVPIFQKHRCPVSIAIITNFVSGTMWPWDAKVRYMFDITKVEVCHYSALNGEQIKFKINTSGKKSSAMRIIREHLKQLPITTMLSVVNELASQLDVDIDIAAPNNYQAFEWSDVRRLEGNGVHFVPHTQNHYILSKLDDKQAKNEIEGSIRDISKHITQVPCFVYPNGRAEDFNAYHVDVLRDNGIKLALSTDNAYLSLNTLDQSNNDSFRLPRISFPMEKNIQFRILSRVDYLMDRIHKNGFKDMFEITYGIKRTAIFNFIEYITQKSYLRKSRKIDPTRIKRIIFICVGNICRSPFAQVVAENEDTSMQVSSMGLEASGKDQTNAMAQKIATEFGYDITHLCSRKIAESEFNQSDLIVVMEVVQLKKLKATIEAVGGQITLLGAWSAPPILSIDDPYGRSGARFRMVFSQIKSSVVALLDFIEQNKKL